MDRKLKTVLFLTVLLVASNLSLIARGQVVGYPSSFQNPRAEFAGVEYNGKIYTANDYASASMHRFDTQLKFDPDGAINGKPNLLGSMTTVFIPKQDLISIPSWVPQDWVGHTNDIVNPVPPSPYQWNISGKAYSMNQWLLHFFVSLDVEWDINTWATENAGATYNYFGENTAVWIKFNLEPIYYIQGAEVAYFGLGKMQLRERVQYLGWDGQTNFLGQKVYVDKNNGVSVSPESQGELCYIYYELGGVQRAEKDEYSYQGKLLNPDIFVPAVYARIDLNKFGVNSWLDWFTYKSRGDTAIFSFDITVWEIGQWTVQDIQQDPGDFGRFVRTGTYGDAWAWFTDNLWWIIPAAIFVVILFFAPWILVLLLEIFRGGK